MIARDDIEFFVILFIGIFGPGITIFMFYYKLNSRLEKINNLINTNQENITTNQSDITTNQENITTNQENITTNQSDIIIKIDDIRQKVNKLGEYTSKKMLENKKLSKHIISGISSIDTSVLGVFLDKTVLMDKELMKKVLHVGNNTIFFDDYGKNTHYDSIILVLNNEIQREYSRLDQYKIKLGENKNTFLNNIKEILKILKIYIELYDEISEKAHDYNPHNINRTEINEWLKIYETDDKNIEQIFIHMIGGKRCNNIGWNIEQIFTKLKSYCDIINKRNEDKSLGITEYKHMSMRYFVDEYKFEKIKNQDYVYELKEQTHKLIEKLKYYAKLLDINIEELIPVSNTMKIIDFFINKNNDTL